MAYTSSYKLRSIPNLRTGLNNRYDQSEILDTDMADCKNIEVDTRSIRNAAGYVSYSNALSTGTELCASFSESNQDNFYSLISFYTAYGQSFSGSGGILDSAKLYLRKVASPTNNITVKIYASEDSSGRYLPDGDALATADDVSASTLSTSFGLIEFSFTGDDRITLSTGNTYMLVIEFDEDDSNYVQVGGGSGYAGNYSYYSTSNGEWRATSNDLCFYVYTETVVQNVGPFYGGFHAKFENGTNRLIRQRGTAIEYDNGAGIWTACTMPDTGSPADTFVPSALPCSFEMLNDTVLWSNGTDSVLSSTDGITWTERATLPKAKVLFNNGKNRILFMALPSTPTIVWWSDINDPVTVGGTSFQFIGKNDGAEIEDAVRLPNGSMLLLKTDRFYQISDITSNMIAVDPVGQAPCVRGTAVSTENSVMWAGTEGEIYEFDGVKANVITDNIERLNISRSDLMRGVYSNQKYRLAVPNGSDAYNSIEYVLDRKLQTGNPLNPYSITKNERYIGCYILEDREVSNVRRTRVYFGDGRADAIGSPAEVPSIFGYINDNHYQGVTQGLAGLTQDCQYTTKFFTEDVDFFIKRYTKYFINAKALTDQEVTVSYRFEPYAQWIDIALTITAGDLDFVFGDGSTGGFDEGYSFSFEVTDQIYQSLETQGTEIRGIQFKISWSSIQDLEILSQAYKFLIKPNFH